MATTLNPAAQALITAGGEARQDEIVQGINDAAIAVGKLFSLVEDDKLPIEILDQLIDWADNPTAAPQQAAGQPMALGAGQTGGQQPSAAPSDPSQITTQQALTALAHHEPRLATVLQRLALGLQSPNTPGALVVDQNGEFTELVAARQEIADKEAERAALESELNGERDQAKAGSLANQLAAAQTAAAVPADMLPKAEVQQHLTAIEHAEQQLHTSMLSNSIENRTELQTAVANAQAYAS